MTKLLARYKKFLVAAAAAGAVALQTALSDGEFTVPERWIVASAVAGAIGVAIARNGPKDPPPEPSGYDVHRPPTL